MKCVLGPCGVKEAHNRISQRLQNTYLGFTDIIQCPG